MLAEFVRLRCCWLSPICQNLILASVIGTNYAVKEEGVTQPMCPTTQGCPPPPAHRAGRQGDVTWGVTLSNLSHREGRRQQIAELRMWLRLSPRWHLPQSHCVIHTLLPLLHLLVDSLCLWCVMQLAVTAEFWFSHFWIIWMPVMLGYHR